MVGSSVEMDGKRLNHVRSVTVNLTTHTVPTVSIEFAAESIDLDAAIDREDED